MLYTGNLVREWILSFLTLTQSNGEMMAAFVNLIVVMISQVYEYRGIMLHIQNTYTFSCQLCLNRAEKRKL
jgi:hypothetical protein